MDTPREPTEQEVENLSIDLAISRVWQSFDRLPCVQESPEEASILRDLIRFAYLIGRRDAAAELTSALEPLASKHD